MMTLDEMPGGVLDYCTRPGPWYNGLHHPGNPISKAISKLDCAGKISRVCRAFIHLQKPSMRVKHCRLGVGRLHYCDLFF